MNKLSNLFNFIYFHQIYLIRLQKRQKHWMAYCNEWVKAVNAHTVTGRGG